MLKPRDFEPSACLAVQGLNVLVVRFTAAELKQELMVHGEGRKCHSKRRIGLSHFENVRLVIRVPCRNSLRRALQRPMKHPQSNYHAVDLA